MRFENKQDYVDKRETLLCEARSFLDDGNVEEGNAKMEAVRNLDEAFEAYAKAQADMTALSGKGNSARVLEQLGGHGTVMGGVSQSEGMYDSAEYRKAFMNYVLRGTPIPQSLINEDANTKTGDVGAVIPETVMNRIIEKLESTGMIYPLVTHTAYKGGLSIPVSTVKPTATWVSEGSGSDKQKMTVASDSMITFAYHKLRCAVSVSLEVDTMALPVFETTFVANVAEAMTKALEQAIIDGSGSGQPKGILSETVVTGQNIDIAKADSLTYGTLCDAEAALPLAYENGAVWFMTKKTFMAFTGMVDADGQPVARVNYGLGGVPERTLLGRTVVLNDYMDSYSDAPAADTVFAFLFRPSDYVVNTNLNMTVKQYEDNDTDDMVTKAVMLVDGKVIDKNSLVTLTKKNA